MKVIVTAAARGIGLAIARQFADEGASVYIGDMDNEAVAEATAGHDRIQGAAADLGDHDQVPKFIAGAIDHLGGIDVLVNNIGIAGPTCLLEDVSFADWDLTMKVNVGSHFYCAREVIPHMKAQRSGAIINISSIAGQLPQPYHSHYAVSKSAVIALTRNLAMELGPFNIRANAICPCPVKGPRVDEVMEVEARNNNVSIEKVRDAYLSHNAMRTFIDADEIASMAVYLASHAGRRISGQAIAVDGNAVALKPGRIRLI